MLSLATPKLDCSSLMYSLCICYSLKESVALFPVHYILGIFHCYVCLV